MKKLFSIFLFSFFFLLFAGNAKADVVCQPIYGGGQSCAQTGNILINKTVADPISGTFVDNLGVNDNKFSPNQAVTFQLTVTNTGSGIMSQTNITDVFPQFISFAGGPGNFDNNSKNLTFSVGNLNPNESRTFTVTGKVAPTNQLPSNQSVVCVVNQAIANSNGQTSQDNAQFCIQTQAPAVTAAPTAPTTSKGGLKVFPPQQVTTTPSTGPEMLPLLALLPSGIAGFFLRKKTK